MESFKQTWVYSPGRTSVADPISRSPAFLATIAAIQHDCSVNVSAVAATADTAAVATTLRGVGKCTYIGHTLDKDFGDTDFFKRHGLVQEGKFWYIGEQLTVPTGLNSVLSALT
jgi:hypothetical protein